FSSFAAGGFVLSNSAIETRMGAKRPNILYIMSDDHSAAAIKCYGGHLDDVIETPNIDRIAAEGMRLKNCFCTNSICTPSRATILTGQYSHVNGVKNLGQSMDRDRQNVARLLQQAGYQTAVVGKWHLTSEPSGFDYYNVLPGQGKYGVLNTVELKEKGDPWGTRKDYEGYATDIITDVSLEWLRNRDKDKPFFLMTHHKAPHGKWEYDPKYEDLYADIDFPEPASLWEDKSHRSEASADAGRDILELAGRMESPTWPTGQLDTTGMDDTQKVKAGYQKYLHDYMRCIASVDKSVGRLLDCLEREGLVEDTVVIYTSDQGMFLGEHEYYDKRWMFEDSLRMPFVVRYPGRVRAGSINEDIITNVDFAPTFLDCAGIAKPPEMQGRSFLANLAGKTPANWPVSMYYRYWMGASGVPAHYGVRTKRYKLIRYYESPSGWELYDMEKDPLEINNVYDDPAYADAVDKMKIELMRLREYYGDTT
ncbi:MAG: sulfatase family protein, partial [Planctomycetota bacterium]